MIHGIKFKIPTRFPKCGLPIIKNCKPFWKSAETSYSFRCYYKNYEMILFYIYNFLSLQNNKHGTKEYRGSHLNPMFIEAHALYNGYIYITSV